MVGNTAQNGGGCSFIGGVSVLADNNFTQNCAAVHGGAIAYTHQDFIPSECHQIEYPWLVSVPAIALNAADAEALLSPLLILLLLLLVLLPVLQRVCVQITGSANDTYPWAWDYPELSQQAGNCSLLTSSADTYSNNHALEAGAIVYASNASTLAFSCTDKDVGSGIWQTCNSPLWDGNTAGNASGVLGYGPGLASDPAQILVDAPPMTSYVSNGTVKMPLVIYARDQLSSNVTGGKQRC